MQFGLYSEYYDLIYEDKDYDAEADYVGRLLMQSLAECRTVLELGCGTGKHGERLAAAGFDLTGVEASPTMLQQAEARAKSLRIQEVNGCFCVQAGDARTVRVGRTFDAVISLFHVVSYQISNADVRQMFETAAAHLRHEGLFVFDVWYGPAVVSIRPAVRIKRMENDRIAVLRIAEPKVDMNRNRVDVGYTMFVKEKATGRVDTLNEQHRMRYYFAPEIDLLAQASGLEIIRTEEWMTGAEPSESTWGVTFVARRVS